MSSLPSLNPLFDRLYVASDHAGFALKEALLAWCKGHIAYEDLGPTPIDLNEDAPGRIEATRESESETNPRQPSKSVDYPDFAHRVVAEVLKNPQAAGLLICGTGVGMSIAANRFVGIRAALCLDGDRTADLARRHNNANVLCLGARFITPTIAESTLQTFLTTPFEGGRHTRRLLKIDPA